jgi:hypothetical protein
MSVRTISTVEPFEALHPILYYLYTNRIYFTTVPIEEAESVYQVPPCNAEDAYRLGDILDLPQLKEKALKFLLDTCDESNIIAKMFGECALNYEEVGKKCETIFYQHWNVIRKKGEFKKFMENLEQDISEQRRKAIMMRCADLMEGLVSQGSRAG